MARFDRADGDCLQSGGPVSTPSAEGAAPPPRPPRPPTRTPTPGELAHRAKDEARDAGYERAALFLLLIAPDAAADVLRQLDAYEIEELCRVIVRVDAVDARDARRVMQEYGVSAGVRSTATGGAPAARRLLTGAFGADHAERLMSRIGTERP